MKKAACAALQKVSDVEDLHASVLIHSRDATIATPVGLTVRFAILDEYRFRWRGAIRHLDR